MRAKKMSWLKRLFKRKPSSFELEYGQWLQAYNLGVQHADAHWAKIFEEWHIGQPTSPITRVTTPLYSVRQRAAQNEVRHSLKTTKLEPLKDIYEAETKRVPSVNIDDFFRNK